MSRRHKKNKQNVIPMRLAPDMQGKVRTLSDKVDLSDADIMRMAIERGLPIVEKMFEEPKTVAA